LQLALASSKRIIAVERSRFSPQAKEGKRDTQCLQLALASSKRIIAVERSRFLPQAKEGKRDTLDD
jgi:hypothetical protein